MQNLRVDFSGLSPRETDRLIAVLLDYLRTAPCEIHLDLDTPGVRHAYTYICSRQAPDAPDSRILTDSIQYVTSDRHYCCFATRSGMIRLRMNFSDVRLQIPDDQFLHCNRGILLRTSCIAAREGDCFRMQDGSIFPIRSRDRKEIIRRYEQNCHLHG